ncbi:MAG: chlorite dismutase family protein [Tropheryma whipplei]|uniref:Coproheme decarboxylase n=1 Tax=Tropheryma whipplei (strain Twist) TaxID=203267 RepID=Q83FJ1_TROWT|nr:hydrogen peroxide-dependent heme synthase [Tropheryma whipplei]AAO44831.1 unknown [Tropheryma whipplei str. Twist]MCO8182454.1 chlorite dismutase family protein [Tropheryma whipplei]CAD67407.1 conserved hypothetical protein [Tropheryma whipplei TW08/27]
MLGAHYALFVVYKNCESGVNAGSVAGPLGDYFSSSAVVLRGVYDPSAMSADANLMLWLHSESAVDLQKAFRYLGKVFCNMRVLWSAMGVHRDAEFNKSHVPAFISGEPPKDWLTIYPFVRTPEWYLIPDEERKDMLAEHGDRARAFMSVKPNTLAAFSLGNYEWLLPMESDSLIDLVDLMRALRYTRARRYVLLETPFYTGRRIGIADVQEVLST